MVVDVGWWLAGSNEGDCVTGASRAVEVLKFFMFDVDSVGKRMHYTVSQV